MSNQISRRKYTGVPALAITVLAFVVGAPVTEARVAVELRGGYYVDLEEAYLGGGVNLPMAPGWDFNPNLEWVFVEDADYFTLNLDIHRDLNDSGTGPAIWVGAGPALVFFENENTIPDDGEILDEDEDLEFGLNLFAGLGAKRGAIRPFSQVKLMLSDERQTSLAFGLRF